MSQTGRTFATFISPWYFFKYKLPTDVGYFVFPADGPVHGLQLAVSCWKYYNIEFQDQLVPNSPSTYVHNGGTSLFRSSTATSTSTVRLITVFHFKPLTIFLATPKLEDGTVDIVEDIRNFLRFFPRFCPSFSEFLEALLGTGTNVATLGWGGDIWRSTSFDR